MSYTAGTNIDITNGVISTVGNTIKNLSAGIVRIWDLDAGVYQLSDNTTSIVYYNGATSTTGMLGVCGGLLYVHLISSSTKSWSLMSDNMSDPYFYMGSTTSSTGDVTRLMKKSEIANNLTTTAEGYMLDARQGKELNDTKASKDPFTGTDGLADGAKGLVPAPTTTDNGKFLCADGTWKTAGTEMVVLSYGNSTWQDFLTAYQKNAIVYCRASSNSDPSSGSQTRMAFMAYVNNASSPTEVEFQYYRSVTSHTATQQGDQVFVYKLTSAGVWSVTTREASTKIVAGTNMSSTYSNGTLTLESTGGGANITYGTTDLTPNVSPLNDGEFYFVYS